MTMRNPQSRLAAFLWGRAGHEFTLHRPAPEFAFGCPPASWYDWRCEIRFAVTGSNRSEAVYRPSLTGKIGRSDPENRQLTQSMKPFARLSLRQNSKKPRSTPTPLGPFQGTGS